MVGDVVMVSIVAEVSLVVIVDEAVLASRCHLLAIVVIDTVITSPPPLLPLFSPCWRYRHPLPVPVIPALPAALSLLPSDRTIITPANGA